MVKGILACAFGLLTGCHLAPPPPGSIPTGPSPSPGFEWKLPAGFPRPAVPPDNPMTAAKVSLGRFLFYDRKLSGNGTYSCATCHRQELAFTDGRAQSIGSTGEIHPRGAMSLANAAYNITLTWSDPALIRLEDQVEIPLFHREPVELGMSGRVDTLLDRLKSDRRYRRWFAAAFPGQSDPLRLGNLYRAIASFERILISGGSPYDRLVYGGEMEALADSARNGMRLFFSNRLRCSRCHGGITFSGPTAFAGNRPPRQAFHNTGLYNLGPRGNYPEDDQGLYRFTGRQGDMGRFRAPTLRNIGLTSPYMHDGSIATLEEVIDHYSAGGRTIPTGRYAGDGRASPNKSELVSGFYISRQEKADLVAFLKSLTDTGFISEERFSDPFETPVPSAPP